MKSFQQFIAEQSSDNQANEARPDYPITTVFVDVYLANAQKVKRVERNKVIRVRTWDSNSMKTDNWMSVIVNGIEYDASFTPSNIVRLLATNDQVYQLKPHDGKYTPISISKDGKKLFVDEFSYSEIS